MQRRNGRIAGWLGVVIVLALAHFQRAEAQCAALSSPSVAAYTGDSMSTDGYLSTCGAKWSAGVRVRYVPSVTGVYRITVKADFPVATAVYLNADSCRQFVSCIDSGATMSLGVNSAILIESASTDGSIGTITVSVSYESSSSLAQMPAISGNEFVAPTVFDGFRYTFDSSYSFDSTTLAGYGYTGYGYIRSYPCAKGLLQTSLQQLVLPVVIPMGSWEFSSATSTVTDTVMMMLSGSSLAPVACSDDPNSNSQRAKFSVTATENTTAFIIIGPYPGSPMGSLAFSVSAVSDGPNIGRIVGRASTSTSSSTKSSSSSSSLSPGVIAAIVIGSVLAFVAIMILSTCPYSGVFVVVVILACVVLCIVLVVIAVVLAATPFVALTIPFVIVVVSCVVVSAILGCGVWLFVEMVAAFRGGVTEKAHHDDIGNDFALLTPTSDNLVGDPAYIGNALEPLYMDSSSSLSNIPPHLQDRLSTILMELSL